MNKTDYLTKSINKAETFAKKFSKYSRRLSFLRLSIAILGIIIATAALFFSSETLSIIAFFLFLVVFTVAAKIHNNIKNTIRKFENWKQIKQLHLSRLSLDWEALPEAIPDNLDNHPFANDLDISGSFSLHRLVNNCISKQGSDLLLQWLSDTPESAAIILKRQLATKKLIPLIHFRDKLSLLAGFSKNLLDADRLDSWLKNTANRKTPGYILPLLATLAVVNLILFFLFWYMHLNAYWVLSLTIYIGLFLGFGRHLSRLFTDTIHLDDALKKIASILSYLQKFKLSDKLELKELLSPIQNLHTQPGKFFSKLNILLIFVGLRQNPLIGIMVNVIFPLDFILLRFLDQFKQRLSRLLPSWFGALHQLDALASLANFAYLHPQYTFPELDEKEAHIHFKNMGHPLILAQSRVNNDFMLNENQKMALLTGSNMSGKSTFQRTVGCNLALAYAGSVVCADYLSASIMRIYSCIRINDALDQGLSYFYAEVKRLKIILDAAGQMDTFPLLYLIDEIFKGTNNKERLSGSRSYILDIIKTKALGLISSHDLELTILEQELGALQNYHFEEQIKAGKMQFDYKLKPGPSPSTNALKIMKMEGLPIEDTIES